MKSFKNFINEQLKREKDEFNWDFDEEEDWDYGKLLPNVGQIISFEDDKVDAWFHDGYYLGWKNVKKTATKVKDIKHIRYIDYVFSSAHGRKVPLDDFKLPDDYDGYMVHLENFWPWYKLKNWKIIE